MAAAPHPFAIPAFRAYFLARICSTLAQATMVVVIGWQVYDIARATMSVKEAAFQLGMIGLAQFLPLLFLSLYAGWVADRVDRRWIARWAIALEAVCGIVLAWTTANGTVSLPVLFAVAALLGVARAFAQPALGALAPNLVPPEVLPSAIAISSLARHIGGVLGPALGGYAYAVNSALPYWLSGGLFVLSCAAMFLVGEVPKRARASGNPWQSMIDGLRYVRHNRLVLGAISLDLFAVLLGGATAMLPIYARDILHVGASGLGHLRAAPAAGAVVVSLLLSWRPIERDVGFKMLMSVVLFGVATMVFGLAGPVLTAWFGPGAVGSDLAPAMLVSLAALAVLGGTDMVSVYVRQSLVQIYTPDAMRGRVGAVSTLFISGSNELGEAESGFLAALVGPVIAVVAGGVGSVLIVALWDRIFPELRAARTFEGPAEEQTA